MDIQKPAKQLPSSINRGRVNPVLPDNFKINLSDNGDGTSQHYASLLHVAYGLPICHIEYNPVHNAEYPFNNEEQQAIAGKAPIFQIGYHGTFHPVTDKFFQNLGKTLGIQTC